MADHDQSSDDCLACVEARRGARRLLIALAFAAGCTDAVTYVELGHVFTANMTGNTVLLGIALVAGDGARIVHSVAALAGFCAGVALAASAISSGLGRAGRGSLAPATGGSRPHGQPCSGRERAGWTRVWPAGGAIVLLAEAAMLAALGVVAAALPAGSGRVYPLILLSGLAMGAQSAAVRAVDVPGVATTYITGTLTGLVASRFGRAGDQRQAAATRRVAGLIWIVYLAAAVSAAGLARAVGAQAIWIPAAVVACVGARALTRC